MNRHSPAYQPALDDPYIDDAAEDTEEPMDLEDRLDALMAPRRALVTRELTARADRRAGYVPGPSCDWQDSTPARRHCSADAVASYDDHGHLRHLCARHDIERCERLAVRS